MLKSLIFTLFSLIFSANSFAQGYVNMPTVMCKGTRIPMTMDCDKFNPWGQQGFVVATPVTIPTPAFRTASVRAPVGPGDVCRVNGQQGIIATRSSWDSAEGVLWNGFKIVATAAVSSFISREVFQALGWNNQGIGTFFGFTGGLTALGETLRPEHVCVLRSGSSADSERIVQMVRGETTNRARACSVDGVEKGSMSLDACLQLGKPRVVQTGGEKTTVSHPAGCEVRMSGVGRKVTDWPGTPETCNRRWTMAEFNAITTPLLPE